MAASSANAQIQAERSRLTNDYLQGPPVAYFLACDGYGLPNKSGDGMTTYAATLGIFVGSGDRRRITPSFSLSGVAACQAGLIKLEDFPGYWMRRVSLLRAQAMHHIVAGDTAAGLADLNAAEAAAVEPNEPYYQRSLGLGIALVRAMALRMSGEQAGAEALATKAFDARPFSRLTGASALAAMGPNARFEAIQPIQRRLAQLDPGATGSLFFETFEHGRLEDVLQLYPSLVPPVKVGDEPMQYRQRVLLAQDNRAQAEAFWAEATSRKAFALAALGRVAEARAAMAEAQSRLARATPAPDPLPPDAKTDQMTLHAVQEQTNLKIRTTVPPILELWGRLVEARILLADHKVGEATVLLDPGRRLLPATWASLNIVEAVATQSPANDRPNIELFRASLAERRKEAPGYDMAALFDLLPEAETLKRLPQYRGGGAGMLRGEDGYKITKSDDQRSTTVRFYGSAATLAAMEEAALLRASELAMEAGSHDLLVTGRRDVERTTINTNYGMPVASFPSGFETNLDVTFSAAPAAANPSDWRRLDAQAIEASLAGAYHKGANAKVGAGR